MAQPHLDLKKVERLNRHFAYTIGWARRLHQILIVLGFDDYCPAQEEFALAVANWQSAHSPLTPDGIIGPKTWTKLEPHTAFTPSFLPPDTPIWLRRLPRGKSESDLISHFHGTSLSAGKQLIDLDITPYILRVMSFFMGEEYKDFTDFGKGFYTFDETGRRNAFGRAKRRFPEWSVVEFQLTKDEFFTARSADLMFPKKDSRPSNAPVLPNSGGKSATWLDFVEYNRGVRRDKSGIVIQRPRDEDYTRRYSLMIGPLWVPRDSGIDEGPPKSPDNFHQFNWGARGLNVLNRSECKARRLLHHAKQRVEPTQPTDTQTKSAQDTVVSRFRRSILAEK